MTDGETSFDQQRFAANNSVQPSKTWSERTVGVFPEGTRVRAAHHDTLSRSEYGEKTWTTGQTIRDLLQNHLDANTQVFFDQLVSLIINIEDEEALKKILENQPRSERFDQFTYLLYLYCKCKDSSLLGSKKALRRFLSSESKYFPIRQEFLTDSDQLDVDRLDELLTDLHEIPPAITYKVADTANGSTTSWIPLDVLKSDEYCERLEASGDFRHQILACKIEDQGKGFDSKLTAYYKSTKTGQKHLRGKFGEGAKMSQLHLLRNGARIKMRSIYDVQTSLGGRKRIWQVSPFLGKNNTVELKGIEVESPEDAVAKIGSYTLINIRDANPQFVEDFRKNIDPRIAEGLASNSLTYSSHEYHYMINQGRDADDFQTMGVSIDSEQSNIYVQGLKIGDEVGVNGKQLFSYDLLSSDVLKGRDRNRVNQDIYYKIKSFWRSVDSQDLLKALFLRAWSKNNNMNYCPEVDAIRDLLSFRPEMLNEEEQHVRNLAFNLIPEVLHLESGKKYIVINSSGSSDAGDAAFIRSLQRKGYITISLPVSLSDTALKNINEYYKGRYELFSLQQAREWRQFLTDELDEQNEHMQLGVELYTAARDELTAHLIDLGFSADTLNLSEPAFVELVDSVDQKVVEVRWLSSSNTFQLVVTPELMKFNTEKQFGKDYWKRYLIAYMLSSFNRIQPFPNSLEALRVAQETANLLINRSVADGQADFDVVPSMFDHMSHPSTNQEVQNRLLEYLEGEQQLRAWELLRESTSLDLSPERFIDLVKEIETVPEEYKSLISEVLDTRVLIRNGKVYFYEWQDDSKQVIEETVTDLPVIGYWRGRPILQLQEKRFIIEMETPNGSVLTVGDDKFVFFNDKLLSFIRNYFFTSHFSSQGISFDKNLLHVRHNQPDSPSFQLDIEKFFDSVTLTAPEIDKNRSIKQLTKTIETPLPMEYGQSEWDNPIRVFQDIAQNHVDASPNREGVVLEYEVERDGELMWVQEAEILEQDAIKGIKILDHGSGYGPEDLGTMGNTSKKSPMFSGKYGEGQKMIAAAAARNGLELSYTSVGLHEGSQYRWNARVFTRQEELTVSGKQTETHRVVFEQTAQQLESNPSFTSATTLRVPSFATEKQLQLWNSWMAIIDPRNKDSKGNGGLSRYILSLRKGSDPQMIDLGYMRIILDEPGSIYENGLLIQGADMTTVAGYDVPEVVDTRERNSINYQKMKTYLSHVVTECPDPRYVNHLMTFFKDRYINKIDESREVPYIREEDLGFGDLLRYMHSNPSLPFWRQANQEILGGLVLHSEEAVENRITDIIGQKFISDDEKKELVFLRSTQENLGHISKNNLLLVPQYLYQGFKKIFPTAMDFTEKLFNTSVPTSPNTLRTLQELVSKSIEIIKQKIAPKLEFPFDNDESLSMTALIKGTTPDKVEDWDATFIKHRFAGKLMGWNSLEEIQARSDSVFVAPVSASYLGIADQTRIGFNERLLLSTDRRAITEISRHEALHKLTGESDYSVRFIMFLYALSE